MFGMRELKANPHGFHLAPKVKMGTPNQRNTNSIAQIFQFLDLSGNAHLQLVQKKTLFFAMQPRPRPPTGGGREKKKKKTKKLVLFGS
jgi:hypothetical protein